MKPAKATSNFFLLSPNTLRTLVVEISVEILVKVLGSEAARWANQTWF